MYALFGYIKMVKAITNFIIYNIKINVYIFTSPQCKSGYHEVETVFCLLAERGCKSCDRFWVTLKEFYPSINGL